jgi:hypothetical protein
MTHPAHTQPNDETRPSSNPAPDSPDWRGSADEGAESERRAAHQEHPRPALRLTTSSDLSTSVPVDRPVAPMPGDAPPRSTGPRPWTAAASSVPRLKVEAPAKLADSGSDLDAPRGAMRAPEPEVSAMDLDEADDDGDGFLGAPRASASPRMPPPKLEEPVWVVAADAVRSSARIQMLLLVAVVLGIAAWALWPKGDPGVSLRDLKKHAARWDGQAVTVKGRVGEVFHVGAGYAFNLHQGRDTIVVFTRGARPESREKISIAGSVSTGYLDGQPRQAIFATPK